MASSTPYDRTTTPPTPQSSDQSQTPPLSETVTKWRANVPPGKSPPPYANRYATRPGTREGLTVARDDDLLKGVKLYSLSERDAPGYFDFLKDPTTNLGTRPSSLGQTSFIDKKSNQRDQDKELSLEQPPSLLIERLQDDVPMKKTTPKPDELHNIAKGQLQSKSKASADMKATIPPRLRRPYRPGIFNIAFSFNAQSRRRASDVTPPISPRTLTPSDAGSPAATPDAPVKRQRIDASTSSPLPQANQPARAASVGMPPFAVFDSATSSSKWWSSDDPSKLIDPKHFCVIPARTEPHPGKLIDFSVANKSLEAIRLQREGEEESNSDDEVDEQYHLYLKEERQHHSPSPHHTRILLDVETDSNNKAFQHQHREVQGRRNENPISGPSLATTTDVKGRRRASSLQRPPQLIPASTSLSSPLSSSSSSSASTLLPRTPRTRTPRTSSDPGVSNPCTSVHHFLTHIRASQEARAAKLRQQVFRDEDMNGWLGDEPL